MILPALCEVVSLKTKEMCVCVRFLHVGVCVRVCVCVHVCETRFLNDKIKVVTVTGSFCKIL